MGKCFFSQFDRILPPPPHVKPAVLRHFYRDLTGDSSASTNVTEEEVDMRVCKVLIDHCSLNSSTECAKYVVFWDNCSQYCC